MDKQQITINGITSKDFYLIYVKGFVILNNLLIIRTYYYYNNQPHTLLKFKLPGTNFKYAIGDIVKGSTNPIVWRGYYMHNLDTATVKRIYFTKDNTIFE